MVRNLKRIALQRMQVLFQLAKENIDDRPDLAQRYVEIAKRIAMRTRLHLPREYRLHVCKHCKRFIVPGANARVRLQPRREPHVAITCLHCGGIMRIPLKRKRRNEQA
jgi:ribonuclease P protein subunit RPR2